MTSPKGNSHRELEVGIHLDLQDRLAYADYLGLDQLLSAQQMQPTTTLKRNLPIWVLNRPEKKS